MSIQAFLDLIRQKFSPTDGKTILQSLTQDPLVWQFFKNSEESLAFVNAAPASIQAFAPGSIAKWVIEQEMELSLPEVKDLTNRLPDAIRQRGAKTFQTLLNTSLPPMDLFHAGLLALTLRERRNMKGSWEGISKEILKDQNPALTHKYFQTWRTVFACLPEFCPDFEGIIADFTGSHQPAAIKVGIPLFLHAYLAKPLEPKVLLDHLFSFIKVLPIDGQLESLQWLEYFERMSLQKTLASHLMQIRDNRTFFANVFSELEALDTPLEGGDPLEKSIPFALPKKLNRLAAFHYHSGELEKAVEVYQRSSDLLNTLQAQTHFQALALQGKNASPSAWRKMIQNLVNSRKVHLFQIRTSIENEDFDEAREKLRNIPDSPEKNFLEMLLEHDLDNRITPINEPLKFLESQLLEKSLPADEFFVRRPEINGNQNWFPLIQKILEPNQKISAINRLLLNKSKDPSLLAFARDELEQAGFLDRALEIASLLEGLAPEVTDHRRALARLYAKSSRWQDSFSLLQKIIRENADPETKDLAAFAESALMTGRIDMSISICQNILNQDKSNAKALILLGKGYMEKGDIVKAIQHMEQVVSLIPEDPQTWIHLAKFWENSGQTDRAFEILRQGILAIPDDPELLHEIGQAHLENGAPAEAKVHLRKAFEKAPTNPDLRRSLAKAEYQLGNYEKSLTLIQPISESCETDFTLAQLLGNVFLAMGKPEKAKPILLSAARQNPFDLDTVVKTMDLVLGTTKVDGKNHDGDIAELEKILEPALKEYPDNPQLKLRLADIHWVRGRYQEAHDGYTQLAMANRHQKDLPDWRVQYGLGLTSTALGDFEIGLAALQDAALAQPNNLQVLHALAETYADADLGEKAFETAKSALEIAPQDIENLIWLSQFNANNNHIEDALMALSEARQIAPDRLDLVFLFAKTLNSKGAAEESVEHLDDLISHENATADLLHQSAYLYIQSQDLDRAGIALEKALKKNTGTNPLLLMDLAVLYTLMDQRKKALELVDLPESTLRNCPFLAMLKANLLSQIGQYTSGLAILDLIDEDMGEKREGQHLQNKDYDQSPLLFRFDFSYKGYLLQRGQLTRAAGKAQEAQMILEKAYNLIPQDHQTQNALVGAYVAGMDYEEALNNIKETNPLGGNPGQLNLDQLDLVCAHVEILLEMDNIEQAEKILNSPHLLEREYPRLLALKSRHASIQGKISEARGYLQRAVEGYQENLKENRPAPPSDTFRMQANLQSMANAFRELGNYPLAQVHQREAWRLAKNQPDNNYHYLHLIIESAEKQQIAQVIKLKAHAPGLDSLDDKHYQLGKELLDGFEHLIPVEEIRCLRARLASAFSGKWPSHLNVEKCLESPEFGAAFILGCEDESQVSEIVSVFPADLPVLQASAIFTLKTGLGDGRNAVEKALEIDTSNPVHHALLGWLNIQDHALAAQSFETAVGFWSEEADWHRILADLYTKLDNTQAAARHITLAIEKEPDNSAYWQSSAGIHLKLNQLEEAKSDLERSTQLQSQDAVSWVRMADVNRRMGNVSEAMDNIRTAASIKPEDSDIAIQEIEFLINQGQYQEAAEKAKNKIGKNGDHPKFRILLARSKAKLGNFDRALEVLTDPNENRGKDPELAIEYLKIKRDRDGIEKTLPELIRLAEQQPKHPEVLKTLTDWLIQTNHLAEAQEAAQTILRILPDSAEVHLMLGRLQRVNGQLDQAISHLSDAISHDPELIDAYIELGKTYQDRRDLEEAIKVFQMGSKADASDPRPYYHAGMALKTCKDYSGAEAMLKQAKKYAPGDANIIRQLGVITALNLITNLRETR